VKRALLIAALCAAAVTTAAPIPVPANTGIRTATKPLAISGSTISCSPAGAGDAGCVSVGPQVFSGDKTFAGDAGVGVNLSVSSTVTSGRYCLSGGVCSDFQQGTYWTFDGPILLPAGTSGVVQGTLYFNPGARLQSNVGNAGVLVQGNCDSAGMNCEDLVVNSSRARTGGWSLRTYNNGQPYAGIMTDGTVVGGGAEGGGGFGVGRAAFQQATTGTAGHYTGSTTLASPDSNPVVIYGSVFGFGGGDTAMGNGALGALGGPHASVIIADHYTTDGGWAFEVDSFRAGPTPGSKVAFIDWAGGYGEYGWSGYLPRTGLSTPIGNQRATFPPCPTIERDLGGGIIQYVGAGGDSALHYDFTPGGTGGWWYCNEEDGGTEGGFDAGSGRTAVGYTAIIDAWHLSHGYGIADAGFQGNVSIDGVAHLNSPLNHGSCVLGGGGTCTHSVDQSCVNPVCSDNSSPAAFSCSASSGTLTAAGTAGHTINFVCF
jgi:hypothetical protein